MDNLEKKTAQEVPVQDKKLVESKKTIELDEEAQKKLFCIALHLSNFLADKADLRWNYKELPIGELRKLVESSVKVTTACEFCANTKCGKECTKLWAEGNPPYYSQSLEMLTELTGVRFLWADIDRELTREGKRSFFKK